MSDSTDLFGVAWKNLKRRKLRAYLTILGIFIGVAAIVALISLGQGMQAAIMDSFSSFGPDLLIISPKASAFGPPGTAATVRLEESDYRLVRSFNGVEAVAKRTIRSATVEFKKKSDLIFTTFLPEDRAARDLSVSVSKAFPEEGRLIQSGESGKINIGHSFKDPDNSLGRAINVGDRLIIDGKSFEVVGIYEKSGRPGGDNNIFFNENDFNELFDTKDEYGFLGVRIAKGVDPDKIAEDLTRALRKHRGVKEGREDFTVQTPGQVLSTFNTIISIVQAVLIGIAAISLMVGGIGVMNTMYTAVLERRKDIGVMKAVGARNSDIFLVYFFESGLLGVVGGAIGVLLGMTMAKMVEIIAVQVLGTQLLQAQFSFALIFGALAFSFIIGSISGTFPALQAARLNPVEALRQ